MNKYFKISFFLPLFLCLLWFLFLFFAADKKTIPPDAETAPPKTVSGENIAEPAIEYLIIAENNYLNLYLVDENLSLKCSERLDLNLLPVEDASMLANGVCFKTIEDAYTMMESYIN